MNISIVLLIASLVFGAIYMVGPTLWGKQLDTNFNPYDIMDLSGLISIILFFLVWIV